MVMDRNGWKVQREEEAMNTPTTAVSFKQYGGNAAQNYEQYFVPTQRL